MSKFSLTVNTDSPDEIARVLAAIAGGTIPAATTAHIVNGSTDDDEDDNAPVNTAAPAVDSAGIPWDERIHTPKKTTLKDGTWRKKKGVSDDLVSQVEAELRARTAGAPPTFNPQPQSPVQQPAPFAPQGFPPSQGVQFPPSQPPVSAPNQAGGPAHTPAPGGMPNPGVTFTAPIPQQPAQTQQPAALDFAGLMAGMQRAMQANKIDLNGVAAAIQEINTAWGTQFTQITDLVSRPDMLDWVKNLFVNKGVWVD